MDDCELITLSDSKFISNGFIYLRSTKSNTVNTKLGS